MKRVRLAVLFLIAVALLAGTSALANKLFPPLPEGTARLTPSDTSDEPKASGRAKYAAFDREWIFGWWQYYGDLTVTCRGLTPGAIYRIYTDDNDWVVGSFAASETGSGTAKATWVVLPLTVVVLREDMIGEIPTLVPVLEGQFHYR